MNEEKGRHIRFYYLNIALMLPQVLLKPDILLSFNVTNIDSECEMVPSLSTILNL